MLPVLWNIGDLDVVVERFSELFEFGLKSFTFSGFLEALGASLNRLGLSIAGGSLPGGIVLGSPVGFLEVLVLVGDIIELILEVLEGSVVNVESGVVVVHGAIEALEDILPLSDEFLSLWGSNELLVESLEVVDLSRLSPSLEGRSEVSDWSGALDGTPNVLNISPFLFDGCFVGDLNLEHVHVFLP